MTNPPLFSNCIRDVIQVKQKYCACDFFDTQAYYCLIYQMALVSLLDKNITVFISTSSIEIVVNDFYDFITHTKRAIWMNSLLSFTLVPDARAISKTICHSWTIDNKFGLYLTPSSATHQLLFTLAIWKCQPSPYLVWRHLWIAPQPSAYYPEIDILLPLKFNTNCKIILHMEFYSLTSIAMLKYYVSCYQYC